MLIGAGVRLAGNPMRSLCAPLAAAVERNTWGLAGALRNIWAGQGTVIAGASIANKSGLSDGALPPASWLMPPKSGGMSSRFNAALSLAAAGLAVGGITTTGAAALLVNAPDASILPADDTPPARTATASFTFDANATGGLISTANGTAAMLLDASGAMLGILDGVGASAWTISTNTPTLGALAGLDGECSFTLDASGAMLPLDDTPPARTATASFSFTGTLSPYALGHMTGTTDVTTALTADQVAAAVLAAAQATPIHSDVQRVRSQPLQGAGTEGSPWGPA